jgi:hypothetical protein
VKKSIRSPLELLIAGPEESLRADAHRSDVVDQDIEPAVFVDCALHQQDRPIREIAGSSVRFAGDQGDGGDARGGRPHSLHTHKTRRLQADA